MQAQKNKVYFQQKARVNTQNFLKITLKTLADGAKTTC